jgi:hypothetical protein
MSVTAGDVALLAPVPLRHLVDGAQVCSTEGRVAFGSRAWKVFCDLDSIRNRAPVDVYIYPSHGEAPLHHEVRWRARYIGHVESVGGAHPSGMRYRPASTAQNPDDNIGYWAVFWELENLHELPEQERIRIHELRAYRTGRRYRQGFVPEGPILISHP